MRRLIELETALFIAALTIVSCGGDDGGPSGPSQTSCGGAQGASVAFCKQVDHYEAGYGVPGQDFIHVTCIVGPAGATLSNAMNGTYTCGGTYKLTTFSTADISLNWGGSTSFSDVQPFRISAPGEGSFTVRVTKTSGGSGNLFFSMGSGSSWMFDVVPVNTGCAAGQAGAQSGGTAVAVGPPDSRDSAVVPSLRAFTPRVYTSDGRRAARDAIASQ